MRKKSEEFEELKKKKLVISLYGPVNSGKSSVVNALTGQKLADVRAIAGWTTEVKLYRLTENAYISDTPGLDDIAEEHSKRAEEFVEQDAHIIIFFLNASVGTPKSAVDAYNKLHSLGKPIIVVLNKIDTIELDEQKDIEQQIQDVMRVRAVPISAKKNIGIDLLHREVMEILEFRKNSPATQIAAHTRSSRVRCVRYGGKCSRPSIKFYRARPSPTCWNRVTPSPTKRLCSIYRLRSRLKTIFFT